MIYLLGGYMWLFIHRPFEVWPVLGTVRLERVYMILMLLVWAISAKSWTSNRLNKAFAYFTVVVVASWLTSPFMSNLIVSQTVENYLKVCVVYVLIVSSVRSEKDVRTLLLLYLASVALYMTHSLWEYRNGRHFWKMGTARMIGVDESYCDPNSFAATLVYSLAIGIPFWQHARSSRERILLVVYAIATAVSVLLTGSRTALVGLAALCLIYVLTYSKYRFRVVVLLAVAAPLGYSMLPEDRQRRFLTIIDPSYGPENAQASADARTLGWRNGVRLWQENPVLGVGPEAHAPALRQIMQSHHLYGQVLGETGTLGAIGLAAIVLGFARNAQQVRKALKSREDLGRPFSAAVVYAAMTTVLLMLLMGFGGHNLFRYTWLWFGAFSAVGTRFALQAARSAAVRRPAPSANVVEAMPAFA